MLWLFLCVSRPLPADNLRPSNPFAPRYAISDLGPLPHVADDVSLKINEAGQVAGWTDAGGGVIHAALWTSGQMRDLGAPLGFVSSMARGLNRQGQAVGWAVTGKNLGDSLATLRACLFSGGKATDLGTLGGRSSQAFGINARGQIVGVSFVTPQIRHAFLWANGKMIDLGALPGGAFSMAYDINDAGQIVGISETAAHVVHGCLWFHGKTTDLGALPGGQLSLAYAVNGRGQTVGSAETGREYHAFLQTGPALRDLGTLGSDPAAALGINDGGQIVGASNLSTIVRHAFLYEHSHLTDLNSLIPANSGWTLLGAQSINSSGQIVCMARGARGPIHAVLLTPLLAASRPQ